MSLDVLNQVPVRPMNNNKGRVYSLIEDNACRDLELVSSFARVRNSGSQLNVGNLFLPGS